MLVECIVVFRTVCCGKVSAVAFCLFVGFDVVVLVVAFYCLPFDRKQIRLQFLIDFQLEAESL